MFSYLTDEVANEMVVEVLVVVVVVEVGVVVDDVVAAQTWAVMLSQPDTHA
jgi:hypothetical protein